MYITEVLPLISLPAQAPQILSYFFDRHLERGILVEGTLGKRKIKGIVLSSTSLEEDKIAVKRADFQLKKLSSVLSEKPQVSTQQLALAAWLARQYYAPIGLCLKTVLPAFFGVKRYDLPLETWTNLPANPAPQKPIIIQTQARDTLPSLRPYLKTALKEQGQVLMIVPEVVIGRYISQSLQESYPATAFLHSGLSNVQTHAIWQSVSNGTTQIIVSTRVGLFLPFKNLQLIIIEDASSEAYKSDMTPRYETVAVATHLAEKYGALFVSTTALPDTAQYHASTQDQISRVVEKSHARPEIIVTDAIQEMRTGNFSMFSRTLQQELESGLKQQKRILFYSARRAYAGVFFCRNCGAVAKCQNCDLPLRVYKTPAQLPGGTETLLICYHCSAYRSAPRACPNCASNQLAAGGVAGSQKIKEALEAFLQRVSTNLPSEAQKPEIFLLDSDRIRTQALEDDLTARIDKSTYPIIIATPMMLSHRYTRRFDLIAVPNADAFTSGRDFRTEERFAQQIEKLLDFQPKTLILQSHNADGHLFSSVRTGDWDDFWKDELEARQKLNYPPFSRLAKLTYQHSSPQRAALSARTLGEKLKMVIHQLGLTDQVQILGPSPASIARENNFYAYSIILKISPTLPKSETILKYVPSDWSVDLDPKSIV